MWQETEAVGAGPMDIDQQLLVRPAVDSNQANLNRQLEFGAKIAF
jgi:hypothetical protein